MATHDGSGEGGAAPRAPTAAPGHRGSPGPVRERRRAVRGAVTGGTTRGGDRAMVSRRG
jgi:hypothetical protein